MNERCRCAAVCLALAVSLLLASSGTAQAQSTAPSAGLLVAPTRVTFDARHRTAALTVMNSGNKAATYRISFVQMVMNEKGQVRELSPEEQAHNPADQLVRFSPRQVYLEPGIAQTVRLQVRKPETLADGEYRSHLLFRMLPNPEAQEQDKQGRGEPGGGLDVQLSVVYGVAVPVIVRHGELWSKVALQPIGIVNPTDKDPSKALVVQLSRSGTESTYGDLIATFVEKNGHEVPLSRMNGLAVYSPNPIRTVRMPLSPPAGLELRGGRIRVAYAKQEGKTPDKAEAIATGFLTVP
jgi:P pilus assembly chaperone PapD